MAMWFYASGGKQLGPVEFPQLQALAAQRQLMPDDLIWADGMTDWQPASKTAGLFLAAAQVQSQPQTAGQIDAASFHSRPSPYVSSTLSYRSAPGGAASETGTLAVTALILSLLGPFSCGSLGFGGVVCGWGALSAMRRSGDFRRQGVALAAIWIGAIQLVILVIALLIFVVALAVGTN